MACHRVGKNGSVVCRVVNRKYAREAIVCGKNLKGTQRYGQSKIYINNSFCPEYNFLNYVCRKLAKDKVGFRCKIKNGVNYVQKDRLVLLRLAMFLISKTWVFLSPLVGAIPDLIILYYIILFHSLSLLVVFFF